MKTVLLSVVFIVPFFSSNDDLLRHHFEWLIKPAKVYVLLSVVFIVPFFSSNDDLLRHHFEWLIKPAKVYQTWFPRTFIGS